VRTVASILLAAALTGISVPAGAAAFTSRPVETRELLVPYLVFLNPFPERAELLGPGAARLTVSISGSNSWAGSDAFRSLPAPAPGVRRTIDQAMVDDFLAANPGSDLFLVDTEVLWTDLSFRVGVHERLDLGIDIPLIRFSGGFMDATIEEFHKTTGFSNAGRPNFERDQFNLALYLGGSDLFIDGTPDGLGIGDMTLSARAGLKENRAAGIFLAATGYLKLPTGSEEDLHGSGSVDFGGQVLFTHQMERQAYHLSAGLVVLGDWDPVPAIDPANIVFCSGTYEYLLWRNLTILGQLGFTSSPYRDATDDDLADPSSRINAGVRWNFSSGLSIDALIEENLFWTNSSADFGLHLGVSYRFGTRRPPSP
jgi:hypothetical protein